MLRKCLFFVLLFIGIVHFSLSEEIDPKEKDFYITPRIGVSTMTGFIGIELQYKHFAFDIGYVPRYLAFGIKYYVNSHRSTAYVGLGSGIWKKRDENVLRTYIGSIFGYRWRWGKGFDFNLGIGFAIGIGKDTPPPPMLELAFGYSF